MTALNKFKTGDKVTFIANDPYSYYIIGDEAVVIETMDNGHTVCVRDTKGNKEHFDVGYFILTSEFDSGKYHKEEIIRRLKSINEEFSKLAFYMGQVLSKDSKNDL